MPSFDIVSEVDKQELDNAINQARKELATRFDFKGITAELLPEKDKITLTAEDAGYLRGLREILIGRSRAAGIKDSAGPRREQGEGNHPGDQVAGFQGAKPAARSTNSSYGKEERRSAGSDSIRPWP